FPSSHHREEGWRRHQENGAKPSYRRRRGGVPCPFDRNTTLSSQKADAAQYFLDRSATPPRGDARRGIRFFKMTPLNHICFLCRSGHSSERFPQSNLDSCASAKGKRWKAGLSGFAERNPASEHQVSSTSVHLLEASIGSSGRL